MVIALVVAEAPVVALFMWRPYASRHGSSVLGSTMAPGPQREFEG
jgi:hypothetical protein